MRYVRFGRSNLQVSAVALGAMGFGDRSWRDWVLGPAEARPIIRRALDAGINLFDTCDFYSAGASETILGRTLLEFVPREEVVLATKAGNPMGPGPNARGFSRKHLFDAIDASLRRLGTDYVDLFQTHVWDPDTDLDEMMDALDALVRSGRTRYVGATTMPAWTFARTLHIAERRGLARLASMQCEYNLCHREAERELLPLCRAEGVALIPFSPLARGFLCADRREAANATPRTRSDDYTRKYYYRDGDHTAVAVLRDVAIARGVSPARVALAWIVHQPGMVSPIFGATAVEHVDDAVAALDLQLGEEEMGRLEAAYVPRPPRAGGH